MNEKWWHKEEPDLSDGGQTLRVLYEIVLLNRELNKKLNWMIVLFFVTSGTGLTHTAKDLAADFMNESDNYKAGQVQPY